MRGLAYVLVGFALILLQGTIHRFIAPFESVELFGVELHRFLHGATPSFVLPMVVYLGLHEHSTARGAFLSFVLGWGLDILSGAPAFLFRFTMVSLWWLSRTASSRVSAQSVMTRVPLAFVVSLVETAIVLILLAIFGTDNRRPLELLSVALPRAVSTALFAPFVFAIAHRMQADTQGATTASANPTAS